MKKYIKLIRIKHYIKNLLIFLPIIFSKNINNINYLTNTFIGFIIFSLLSSVIYIINDLKDAERDKKHPIKCKRTIASGEITKKQAYSIIVLLIIIICISVYIFLIKNIAAILILVSYFIINILYTLKLKEIPIVDILILVIGFLLRVIFGAEIISVVVSNYLYLTILSISFYMAMGKRRNEILRTNNEGDTRKVLKEYNENFLNENMYMFLGLAIIFYSLWCVDMSSKIKYIMYTIPIVMIITMKYSLSIEKGSYGDPVDVILKDKVLLVIILLFSLIVFSLLFSSLRLFNSLVGKFLILSSDFASVVGKCKAAFLNFA